MSQTPDANILLEWLKLGGVNFVALSAAGGLFLWALWRVVRPLVERTVDTMVAAWTATRGAEIAEQKRFHDQLTSDLRELTNASHELRRDLLDEIRMRTGLPATKRGRDRDDS